MADDPISGLRVLLIEDSFLAAATLKLTLERFGCTVLPLVGSVADGRAAIDGGGFDVAIIDVNLPDGTSYSLAELMLRKDIPFAFATGYNDHVVRAAFLEGLMIETLETIPLLRKPVTAPQVREVLEQLIADGPTTINSEAASPT